MGIELNSYKGSDPLNIMSEEAKSMIDEFFKVIAAAIIECGATAEWTR